MYRLQPNWRLTPAGMTVLCLMLAVPGSASDSDLSASKVPFDQRRDGDFDGENRVTEVQIGDTGQSETLVLKEFQVFAPETKIVVHEAAGDRIHPIPSNRYFKGHVEGSPGSSVYVSVLESGQIRGIAGFSGRYWMIGGAADVKSTRWAVEAREVDLASELGHDTASFECGTDDLPQPLDLGSKTGTENTTKALPTKAVSYTARIAVETDNEFFNKFGNATDATNYVADIIAFGSTIYSAEVNTSWILQHLSLWPTGQTDPWSEPSPGCGLYEFGRYWNDNYSGVSRTTTHFMSGKTSNSGIAWVGVLCRGPFDVNLGTSCPNLTPSFDNFGGAYGYTGGMDANFDINNPAAVWDVVAVTHEIGHNFNSPHTHCYADLEGNANPIDECYSLACGSTGCFCGTAGLPGGCPGGGSGCGTIMSYCHSQSGGLGNISLTLGLGHPYGVEPERVPERMFSHVSSRALSYPGCLDYTVADSIFTDGFEDGNTNNWD